MDIPIHDQILWKACNVAHRRMAAAGAPHDPRLLFPLLSRGSWMNDVNQVTLLLDHTRRIEVTDHQRRFFGELWQLSLRHLLDRLRVSWGGKDVADGFGGDGATDVAGFAKYDRHDHLDVLTEDPAVECANWAIDRNFGRSVTVHQTVSDHVANVRLISSTIGRPAPERVTVNRLTILGRALHTVADFYAHSNYVELLLWTLTWEGKLDGALVAAFNASPTTFLDEVQSEFRCPLPRKTDAIDALVARDAILWYGPSPKATPLVSSVFDLTDTAASLLEMYAARLQRTDGTPMTDDAMDLALAVFDVPGEAIVRGAWKILQAFQDALQAIGKAARGFLADRLEGVAKNRTDKTEKEALELTAKLVRRYDSKEADQWAKAGRARFVARTLHLDIAEKLHGQKRDRQLLPHHTLLAKDHRPSDPEDAVRYSLACLLATEVSARLIEWHFSAKPEKSGFTAVADKCLVHPALQVADAAIDADKVAAWALKVGSIRWEILVEQPDFGFYR